MTEIWNALYLKPRSEKKVEERLRLKGYEVFLPLAKVRKRYTDRWKEVDEPLLKSYIFIAAEMHKNPDVLRTEGVMNYVNSTTTGKVALIKKEELEAIRGYLQQRIFSEKDWEGLRRGDHIVLTNPAFQNKQAEVLEVKKNTIRLMIEDLGFVWEVRK